MLYQFLNRPVSQLETVKWLVARPIQGIIMGSFLYLIVEGGLFILSSEQVVRTEMAAVIGFLGGFSDKFTEEMVRRATSILTQDGSEQKILQTTTRNLLPNRQVKAPNALSSEPRRLGSTQQA